MRKQISKKEIKDINGVIEKDYGIRDFISKKANVEVVDDKIISVNGEAQFFYLEDKIIPCLKLLMKDNFLPLVVIDMPAVKFIVSGADIMRPGIKEIGDFEKGGVICIVDENNKKPLALGITLFSSSEMKDLDKGKVITNIHYVGDEVWSLTTG